MKEEEAGACAENNAIVVAQFNLVLVPDLDTVDVDEFTGLIGGGLDRRFLASRVLDHSVRRLDTNS